MGVVATRKMTFDEFLDVTRDDPHYELVDGRLVPLMTPTLRHGSAQSRLSYFLEDYLGDDFRGFLGDELDFPTLPHHGRRGDIVYLAPEHVTEDDWERGYPSHAPDLVIEVLSEGGEWRDTTAKRREYSLTGIANYWIVDPVQRTIETLALGADGTYSIRRHLTTDDVLTSPLFPGLEIPLRRVFRR